MINITTVRYLAAITIFSTVAGTAIAAPASESEFHSKVAAIYNFEPQKLNDGQMKEKSEQLDQFWSSVKADSKNYLPFLRKELNNPSSSAFFFYDGSQLLLSLSKEQSDRALALKSIPKADINGLQPTDYLQSVHWFAQNGFDTREAAFRILAYSDFKAFIPQHALTLGQDFSLIYMLFPMDETIFAPDLVQRLSLETTAKPLKSVLLALWYTATPAGNAAIRKFADDPKGQPEAKTYAKELLARKVPKISSASLSTATALREERRKVMRRPISDEALGEFDKLTAQLIAKQ
jgi:hypothetical protein